MRGTVLALALFTGAAWVQAQNLAGVKAIVASGNTSYALLSDGTVWEWPIWEFKPYRAAKSLVPVQVAGLCDIVAIAEGGGHSLALKRDGTVWAWGQNIYGQLGVRTFAVRTTPVQVVAPAAP